MYSAEGYPLWGVGDLLMLLFAAAALAVTWWLGWRSGVRD